MNKIYYSENQVNIIKKNHKNLFMILNVEKFIEYILPQLINLNLNETLKNNIFNVFIDIDFESFIKKISQKIKLEIAAGGIIENEDKKWLCIFRRNMWDFPKGHIEKNEDEKDAAIREVQEECGIKKLEIKEKLNASYYFFFKNNDIILKKVVWFKMHGSKKSILIPQTTEEITRVEWLDSLQVKTNFKNTFPALRDIVYNNLNK